MKTVSLSALAKEASVTVCDLFAMRQTWAEGQTFVMDHPRRQSAFLYFVGGEGEFLSDDGSRIAVPRGALVYIPEGSRYTLRFGHCVGEVTTLLAEFRLSDGESVVLSGHVFVITEELSDRRITDLLWSLAEEFDRPERSFFTLRARYFTLFAVLAQSEILHGIHRKGAACIEKGIRYLQTDGEQSLSMEKVAALCPVSPAYFRRVFRECFGVSPSEYRTARRMERAKEMLAHTDLSIEEISRRLGFDTPSYFCRTFRQKTGVAPSVYRKTLL